MRRPMAETEVPEETMPAEYSTGNCPMLRSGGEAHGGRVPRQKVQERSESRVRVKSP